MPRDHARSLARDLRRETDAEVRFDRTSRALYSTDASNYRAVPIGVVIPRSAEDVARVVGVCSRHEVPIVSRGGGTSLAGQTCNVAVVLDFSKHIDRVLEIDPDARTARVEPGVVHDRLTGETEERYRLTFGPDPATHRWCTFGGMIGNNSCGIHAQMSGRTVLNVHRLHVLTYDGVELDVGQTDLEEARELVRRGGRTGEILQTLIDIRERHAPLIAERYPDIPRRVSGYALEQLLPKNGFHVARSLVGSEGTCVTLLDATVRLVHSPPHRSLLVIGYEDVFRAADHVPEILRSEPLALEGVDHELVELMKAKHMHRHALEDLPEGHAWLFVEVGGETREEARERGRALQAALRGQVDAKAFVDHEADEIWEVREAGLGATARTTRGKDNWPGWEDAGVPPERIGAYLRDFHRLLGEYGYHAALYGHFGQGCIHCRIDFDLRTPDGIRRYRSFVTSAAELVTSYGGSLSGEHGDGKARGQLLPIMFGEELMGVMRAFKRAWDPTWKMNPGRVVAAEPIDSGLRLGSDFEPRELRTSYRFTDDGGSFARAAMRCVGVGKCRRREDAFMCPSFLATHDEKDTTRGRARVLFEMARGDFVDRGWRSAEPLEALDLCLGCKACKHDCPVGVDMARYKSEFLHHHWSGRIRPRSHYAMGLLGTWLRLARPAPRLADFLAHAPGLGPLAKLAAGIGRGREIPHLARERFTERLPSEPANPLGRPVVLAPDLFADAFHPDVLHAAHGVLERLGLRVIVAPKEPIAIRPLLHFGMLDRAVRNLRRAVTELGRYAQAGIPLVGLEPSMVSAFRDEAPELLGDDRLAASVSRSFRTLSELLDGEEGLRLPDLGGRRVILHVHCHQKAVLDKDAPARLLRAMNAAVEEPDPSCCGMAGAFGMEAEHVEVSRAIGELSLLPAVRAADAETWITADGFSCREQIGAGTDREPMHLAQLLRRAFSAAPQSGPPTAPRARRSPAPPERISRRS